MIVRCVIVRGRVVVQGGTGLLSSAGVLGSTGAGGRFGGRLVRNRSVRRIPGTARERSIELRLRSRGGCELWLRRLRGCRLRLRGYRLRLSGLRSGLRFRERRGGWRPGGIGGLRRLPARSRVPQPGTDPGARLARWSGLRGGSRRFSGLRHVGRYGREHGSGPAQGARIPLGRGSEFLFDPLPQVVTPPSGRELVAPLRDLRRGRGRFGGSFGYPPAVRLCAGRPPGNCLSGGRPCVSPSARRPAGARLPRARDGHCPAPRPRPGCWPVPGR